MTRRLMIFALMTTATFAAAQTAADHPYAAALEGKWIQRDTRLVLDIAAGADGTTFTYSVPHARTTDKLSFVTRFDGADAPMRVNGSPTGQSIAMTFVDAHRANGITKFQGKATGSSKSELSDDGKVLRVDNDVGAPGSSGAAPRTEVWDKQ